MNRFIKIGKAAEILGVSVQTLRRWEAKEALIPDRINPGGTRYYDLNKLLKFKKTDSNLTVGYARVSSHDQKKDLQTQAALLTSYCAAKGIDTMTRSHKIRLDPTFKQMSYFRKACGIARFAWNWGLALGSRSQCSTMFRTIIEYGKLYRN